MSTEMTDTPRYCETLEIEGMTCASCVGRVEKALKSAEGVESAHVNLATEKAVIYGHQPLDRATLIKVVEKAGYEVEVLQPIELTIEGMSCASCVGRVEKALKSVEGVESAHVNLATEKATIQASSSVTRDSLIQAVTKAGFEAKSVHQTTESFQDKKNIELGCVLIWLCTK